MAPKTLTLASAGFQQDGTIPRRHTADGPDLSPPLEWSGLPSQTSSLSLVCDDPDAPVGTWVHWVIFNIPPKVHGLPEGVPVDPNLPDGTRQGRNDFGRTGYGGPAPPRGPAHRYYFRLFALDIVLDLPAGTTRAALDAAMEGHVLAEGLLMARYGRS
ncbi:MAG TPA: YbhB/YbcL family Raf kinase inhibitor-like protein [Candidatus Polarisedimenticolia bacterium]|nr:YbhB/YbcL family Raf kinase inhibitor-like protein [Candidatus Polarisedimenticolia bacterium]